MPCLITRSGLNQNFDSDEWEYDMPCSVWLVLVLSVLVLSWVTVLLLMYLSTCRFFSLSLGFSSVGWSVGSFLAGLVLAPAKDNPLAFKQRPL